jgi:hypothetical protein
VLPAQAENEVASIEGKTSRGSAKISRTPLHLVSAFGAGAGGVLGQKTTAEKPIEKAAIPELLANVALEGSIVALRNYLLLVRDNQPTLAEFMADFFQAFEHAPSEGQAAESRSDAPVGGGADRGRATRYV